MDGEEGAGDSAKTSEKSIRMRMPATLLYKTVFSTSIQLCMVSEFCKTTADMYASVLFVALAATFLLVVTECRWDFNENDLHYIRAKRNDREHDIAEKRYTSSWAVEITEGGDNMADETAARYAIMKWGVI